MIILNCKWGKRLQETGESIGVVRISYGYLYQTYRQLKVMS